MVGVQVGQKHLVEQVDRQLQACIVRERTGPEVEHEQVALGVADLDEDARRGLGTRRPRIAATEHRHAQLAVFKRLGSRDEHLGVLPLWGADDGCLGDGLSAPCVGRYRQRPYFHLTHFSSSCCFV